MLILMSLPVYTAFVMLVLMLISPQDQMGLKKNKKTKKNLYPQKLKVHQLNHINLPVYMEVLRHLLSFVACGCSLFLEGVRCRAAVPPKKLAV